MSVELPIAISAVPAGPAAARTGGAKSQTGATTDPQDADDAFSVALSTADGAPADAGAAQDDASGLKTKGKSETQAADGSAVPQPPAAGDSPPPPVAVDNALLLAQSALSGRDQQGAEAAASAAAAAAAAAAATATAMATAAGSAATLASAAAAGADASAASAMSRVSGVSALSAASVTSADGAAGGFLPIGRAVPRGPVPVQALVSDAGRGAAGRGAVADAAGAHGKPAPRVADAATASPTRGTAANPGDALASGSASASGVASAATQAAQAASSASMSSQTATQRLVAQDAAHAAAASASATATATASAAMAATVNATATGTDAAALQAMLGADVFGRRSERPDERTPGAADTLPGAVPGSGGTAGASGLMTPVDAASAGASPGQNDLTDRMLEQVSWWLSQKTQGAELKLDVAGGQTVSVSVKVQGNEAHVAFRSDQPEVRQMLNQAMPQLKELLGSEGLMLSGSSVGAQSDGSNQAASQQAARQWQDTLGMGMGSAPAAAEAVRTAPAAISRAPSGRSLDLYV